MNIGRLLDELVTSLARCRHNKNILLLTRLAARWRHDRIDDLFYAYHDIPLEAVRVLQE